MDNDLMAFVSALVGGGDQGAAAMAATPKLTKRSKNLPEQQYNKSKKALKEMPGEEEVLEGEQMDAPPGSLPVDGIVDSILQMIMGPTAPATPEMVATKDGAQAYPKNFNPMSKQLQMLEALLGEDLMEGLDTRDMLDSSDINDFPSEGRFRGMGDGPPKRKRKKGSEE